MTLDRAGEGQNGRSLDELEPGLRERVLALDEPVAWGDWEDVVSRSRRSRLSARRRGVLMAIASSGVVVAVAGSIYGFRVSSPDHVDRSGSALAPVQVTDGSHTLYVSPTRQGGFCYEWTGGAGGCQSTAASLGVAWGRGRVAGAVSRAHVSSVSIRFTDGTTAKPDISWISAPINAGFFLYEIPAGKTVAEINGYDNGRTRGQVTWYSV